MVWFVDHSPLCVEIISLKSNRAILRSLLAAMKIYIVITMQSNYINDLLLVAALGVEEKYFNNYLIGIILHARKGYNVHVLYTSL